MRRVRRSDEGYGLGRALLWSVVLHVPLLLLIWLFLVSGMSSADVARAQEEIRFTFDPAMAPEPTLPPEPPAEQPEPAVETAGPIEDDTSIFDQGPQPESESEPETSPEPSRLGAASTEALFRESAPPPPEAAPREAEPADRPVERMVEQPDEPSEIAPTEARPEEEPAEPAPETREPVDAAEAPEGIDLPETGAEPYRSPSEEPPPRRFDPGTVVRDLRRYLAEGGRPPRPPSDETEGEAGNPDGIDMPDLEDLPFSGFGLGAPVFESSDYDWSDYGRVVYTAIRRAWFARLYATHESFDRWAWSEKDWFLKHAAGLRFVIERNGEVTSIRILQESGCGPLDDSAYNALEEVVLPPLPADFPRDRETVRMGFLAEGNIRHMRPYLENVKRAGGF